MEFALEALNLECEGHHLSSLTFGEGGLHKIRLIKLRQPQETEGEQEGVKGECIDP